MVAPTHLLDTSTLLWAVGDPEKLSEAAREICSSAATNPAVSVVSLMELIVKAKKGKLSLAPDPVRWWDLQVGRLGFIILPLLHAHVERLWTLPLVHSDPADRLLISQAMTEGVPLVSYDRAIRQYPLEIVW